LSAAPLPDPHLAAKLCTLRSVFTLFGDERFLRIQIAARLHPTPLLLRPGKRAGKHQLQTIRFLGVRSQMKCPLSLDRFAERADSTLRVIVSKFLS
jgi:hypothetical protein